MKKTFLSFALLIITITVFCQHPIGNDSLKLQTLGDSKTLIKSKGAIGSDSGFVNAKYADTSAANKGKLKNYPGAQIRVVDTIFVRNSTATKWINQSVSSGGGSSWDAAMTVSPNLNNNYVSNLNNKNWELSNPNNFSISRTYTGGTDLYFNIPGYNLNTRTYDFNTTSHGTGFDFGGSVTEDIYDFEGSRIRYSKFDDLDTTTESTAVIDSAGWAYTYSYKIPDGATDYHTSVRFRNNGSVQFIIDSASSPVGFYGYGSDGLMHRYAAPSGGSSFEPIITAPNTINKYWNGYKQFVSLNTDSIAEGSTNKFYTDARSRAAISLTTTGINGASTYNNSTGVLNVPQYSGGVTKAQVPFIINSSDSISKRWNVLDYVGSGYVMGTTDATAAINRCIAACIAGGGGEVYFPNGTYIIGGALDTSNSQIVIKSINGTSALRVHLVLRGEVGPVDDPAGEGLSGDAATPIASQVTILKSTLTTGAAGAAVIGTSLSSGFFNAIALDVKDISIQVKNNRTGGGPAIGGINWRWGNYLHFDDVAVYIDTSGFRSVMPTNNVAAFEAPDNSSGDAYIFENCQAIGFRIGYKFGEHCTFNQTRAATCYYAYYAKVGGHSSKAIRALAQWCAYDLYIAGAVSLTDFNLDAEWQQIGKWYDDIATIKDSANLAQGQVIYEIVEAGFGLNNAKFIKSGGANLYTLANTSGVATQNLTNLFSELNTFSKGLLLNQTGTVANNTINIGSASSGAVDNSFIIHGAGVGSSVSAATGPYFIMRGNNFSGAQQRGAVYIASGAPTTPLSGEALIGLYTNGVQGFLLDKDQKVTINSVTTADALAQTIIGTSATTNKGLVIQGKASQTANLLELQKSDGTKRHAFGQSGNTTLQFMYGGASGTEAGKFFYDGPDGSNAAYGAFMVSTSGGYAGVTGGVILSSSKNGSGTQLPILIGGYSGSWVTWQKLNTNGTIQMPAYGAGTATFDASGNITSVSDERLKTHITPYKAGLREILKLKPITYKYNSKSKLDTVSTYAGFSAQNVKANIPYGTGENKDGYMSLQERAIIAALVNAVKELQAEIDSLKKQLKK